MQQCLLHHEPLPSLPSGNFIIMETQYWGRHHPVTQKTLDNCGKVDLKLLKHHLSIHWHAKHLSWKGHSLHSLPCLYTHRVCHWTDLLIYRNMLNTMTLTRGSEGPPKAILASLRNKLPSETWMVTPTPPTSVLRLALFWMTFLSGSCPVMITNLTIATTLWTHGPHSLQEVKPLDHQHQQQHERKGRFSAAREPLPQLNLP